ncbi:MAG: Rrf2 family transcriptional regulator [Myxococcales bacterium]|nr:Rrf2 family transcriptional regulator [Myxococcales bacterium]USN50374.1 MAG: Rrf2 family transcriptional regulator [Myxococcales bacterium]
MFKIARLTDYGVVLLGFLASRQAQSPISARDLSKASGLPLPTVSKLLKLLAKHKIVSATRGTSGGYQLSLHPDQVSLLEIIEVFEGSQSTISCLSLHHQRCPLDGHCPQRNGWQIVHNKLTHLLKQISLSELISSEACAPTLIRGIRHG